MEKRKNPSVSQRTRLIDANAGRCCVCKRSGVGLHLHHIDGDSSNTIDENLAVLCVQDHDCHHRPYQYPSVNHLDISSEKLLEYKISWESFVANSHSDNPSVIAVINCFGDYEKIHAAKILFQWPNERIELERTFHLLQGNFDYWTDEMISEVRSIGKRIKLIIIDKPLPIEYCDCCGNAYSRTLKEGMVIKATDLRWETESICSIYINPETPSLAITVGLSDKHIYSGHLHLCQGKYLHYTCDYFDERTKVKKKPSIRSQATSIIEKVVSEWDPANIFIGTGDHDSPKLVEDLNLPKVWENRFSNNEMQRTQKPRP